MPEPNLRLTGGQFVELHRQDVAQRRTRYRCPELLDVEKKISEEQAIHIFSVSPWRYTAYCGSSGRYIIPECSEDTDWVAGPIVPAIYAEPWPAEGGTMTLFRSDGKELADAILGVGKGLSASSSLIRQGVWAGEVRGPAGATPKPSEVATARAELTAYFQELYREGNQYWETSPQEASVNITDRHRLAAARLGLDTPWVSAHKAVQQIRCPACSTFSAPDVVLCRVCSYVFDIKRFKEIQNRLAKSMEAPK